MPHPVERLLEVNEDVVEILLVFPPAGKVAAAAAADSNFKSPYLQRLQIATLKVPHYVRSLTIVLFILLNCMPFTLPLGSSASLRKSPSWCCLILCLF